VRILITLFLLIAVSINITSTASAYDSQIKGLVEFSKERLKGTREIENYDEANGKQGEKKQENISKPQEKKSHMEEVKEAVKFASEEVGVREDFLLGMLVVESDLGRNTGKCTYTQVEEGAEKSHRNNLLGQKAYNTFVKRRDLIKTLAKELGRDYKKLKVSCSPAKYVGTGGAMGVPQFMPDIWAHYKDRISEIVGKNNPDPWILKDGIVAMALLLSDTPGVTGHNHFAERNAAKKYLSGTTSWRYDWYANKIMYWAKNHKQLMG
jgi:hypothetical protein